MVMARVTTCHASQAPFLGLSYLANASSELGDPASCR